MFQAAVGMEYRDEAVDFNPVTLKLDVDKLVSTSWEICYTADEYCGTMDGYRIFVHFTFYYKVVNGTIKIKDDYHLTFKCGRERCSVFPDKVNVEGEYLQFGPKTTGHVKSAVNVTYYHMVNSMRAAKVAVECGW